MLDAWKSIQSNISNALETLDNEVNRESNPSSPFKNISGNSDDVTSNDDLNEVELYKQLLDEAQFIQVDISNQSKLLVSEKEGEIKYLKKLLQDYNISIPSEQENIPKDSNIHDSPSASSSSTTSSSSLSYEKLKSEKNELENQVKSLSIQLKESLKDKSEIKIINLKNHSYQLKINSLQQKLQELTSTYEKNELNKNEAIDNLVQEYSNLASESEIKHMKDQTELKKLRLDNEGLLFKIGALEHNISDFADRAVASSSNQIITNKKLQSSSENPTQNNVNSNNEDVNNNNNSLIVLLQQELKETKAKMIHLQYDLKLRDDEILVVKTNLVSMNNSNTDGNTLSLLRSTHSNSNSRMVSPMAGATTATTTSTSGKTFSSSSPLITTESSTTNTASTNISDSTHGTAVVTITNKEYDNLKTDIIRLQIEKREAQDVGKLAVESKRKIETELSDTKKQIVSLQTQIHNLQSAVPPTPPTSSNDNNNEIIMQQLKDQNHELTENINKLQTQLHESQEIKNKYEVLLIDYQTITDESETLIIDTEKEYQLKIQELQQVHLTTQQEQQVEINNITIESQQKENNIINLNTEIENIKQQLSLALTSSVGETNKQLQLELQAEKEKLELELKQQQITNEKSCDAMKIQYTEDLKFIEEKCTQNKEIEKNELVLKFTNDLNILKVSASYDRYNNYILTEFNFTCYL